MMQKAKGSLIHLLVDLPLSLVSLAFSLAHPGCQTPHSAGRATERVRQQRRERQWREREERFTRGQMASWLQAMDRHRLSRKRTLAFSGRLQYGPNNSEKVTKPLLISCFASHLVPDSRRVRHKFYILCLFFFLLHLPLEMKASVKRLKKEERTQCFHCKYKLYSFYLWTKYMAGN